MAERTLTSGPAYSSRVVPRYVHAGAEIIPFSWDAGGQTISVSDVVSLVKVPKDAVIVDVQVFGWYGSDGGATVDFGLNSDVSAFASAKTISATATVNVAMANGYIPYKVSISDDAGVDYRTVQAKFVTATSATTTAILKGRVIYTSDTKIKD